MQSTTERALCAQRNAAGLERLTTNPPPHFTDQFFSNLLVWIFNAFGTLDLAAAITLATIYKAPVYMGAAYWIPAFWVPALLVSHYVTFVVLMRYKLGGSFSSATPGDASRR